MLVRVLVNVVKGFENMLLIRGCHQICSAYTSVSGAFSSVVALELLKYVY
jgi:hypothetical protein